MLPVFGGVGKAVLGGKLPRALAVCGFLAPEVASRGDAAVGVAVGTCKLAWAVVGAVWRVVWVVWWCAGGE